jgi:RNA ligase (TIGR02306 family)
MSSVEETICAETVGTVECAEAVGTVECAEEVKTVECVEADRSLATICRIKNIYPISGADLIVLAEIQGWKCIVKKNEFNVGDLCIYFSIDAIPDLTDPNTEFMTKRGGRIRTIKMRGVISQGLIGQLTWLSDRGHNIDTLSEGDDVTTQMGSYKVCGS